jgi:hypothetical protein
MDFQTQDDPIYKETKKRITAWLLHHQGESFDLDLVCRQCELTSAKSKNYASTFLSKEVASGRLEKNNKIYHYIDTTILKMNWRESSGAVNLPLDFPCGMDGSQFGFDGHLFIPEKGLIVLAGVTNTGKSVFMRNLLFKNMDIHHCVYFSSETSEDDFADYISRMTWANPVNDDGTDKFDLIWRDKDFKYAIQPNAVNIVDWFNIYDEFYRIGEVLDSMKNVLNKGILAVAIQKDPLKGLGVGGMWAEHKASLYMTMDFGRLTVEKAKKWSGINPNHKTWGFEIVDQGTHFNNIRPLIKCHDCWGTGKKKGVECTNCNGSGWADVIIQTPKTDYINDTF